MNKRIATVQVVENIHAINDAQAEKLRARLDAAGVHGINLMSAPGSGKTTLIEATLRGLAGELAVAVIDGDIATTIDADRAAAAGAVAAVQINTGGNCHLEANMLAPALDRLDLAAIDLLIVENVGNLICPANFAIGTHHNVVIASAPEGWDKPYKYPGIFTGADVVLVTKWDAADFFEFDLERFSTGVRALNRDVMILPLSAKTGEGMDAWLGWLTKNDKEQVTKAI